jgi:putative oxidoreductase
MIRLIREIPGLLGKILVGTTFVTRAFGDAVLDAEEMGPFLAPNNIPDPQLRLAGAIVLLFAGSLSILAVGYVVDSTRDGE